MLLSGKRKAAMLLMSLDHSSAAELLKGLNANMVRDIAVEVAFLEGSGYRPETQGTAVVREFCDTIKGRLLPGPKSFLGHMLNSTVGSERAGEINAQIQTVVRQRDPFMAIRQAATEKISAALKGEHPQVVATVLGELPLQKSSEILSSLEDKVRGEAVRRMTNPEAVPAEAKLKIATVVERKIVALSVKPEGASPAAEDTGGGPIRKVAVLLRGLGKELRNGLVLAIEDKDPGTAKNVMEQMVTWDDWNAMTDRSLQEALRGVESKLLATAMMKAEDDVVRKIRANISERAAAMVDEEASFMTNVSKEEIAKARGELVGLLREQNAKGQLVFVEQ